MRKYRVKESALLGEKYYYIKHESGLDIYVYPKKLRTVYAMFGTRFGSCDNRFEKDGKEIEVVDGVAHFLEHKMFESEDGEDLFVKYARVGANANAYTSFLHTMYLFSCTENFPEALKVLLEGVCSPYFTAENVQKEQGIIAQEIKMYEDEPGQALYFGLLSAMYEKHTVRINIAGTVGSISKITPELLYDCYNTFYNLGNMALCVCGEVSADEVLDVADAVLKKAPKQSLQKKYYNESAEVYKKRFTKSMQVSAPKFAIGVKDVEISEDPAQRLKKNAAMSVLSSMLFGASSEFSSSLYSSGATTGMMVCEAMHNRSFSALVLEQESKDPEAVYEKFVAYTAEIAKNGIDRGDFERAVKALYSSVVKNLDSTEDIANDMLHCIFDGYDIFDMAEAISNLSFEYTEGVARSLFKESAYSLAVIEPLKEE